MSLSYAGVPLIFETKELQEFLEDFMSLEDLRQIITTEHPNRTHPDRPTLRINQLYWPAGAQRWALFHGLVTAAGYARIAKAYKKVKSIGATLIMGDNKQTPGVHDFVLARMHLLPARHITSDLYLLTLVDQRYLWQFRATQGILFDEFSTWDIVYSSLAAALDITIVNDTVPSEYLSPDPPSFNRQHDDPAKMLDEVAHSIGQRIVVEVNGTVRAQNWAKAESQLTINRKIIAFAPIAGGASLSTTVGAPEEVLVSFPKLRHGVPRIDGERYRYDKSQDETSLEVDKITPDDLNLDGMKKRFRSTAYADFTGGLSVPDNDAALDGLAQRIADDYYDSITHQYDHSFSGIVNWVPCAYDDHILWTWGVLQGPEIGSRDRRINTRVQSAPLNFGWQDQFHQDPDLVIYDTLFKKGVADEEISWSSCGTVSIWEAGSDSGNNVEACWDWHHGWGIVQPSEQVLLHFFHSEDSWVITSRGLYFYVAKTDGSGITARSGDTPGSGTVTLYHIGSDGTLESLGQTVTCYNSSAEAVQADEWINVDQDTDGKFWVVVESCPT